MPSSKAARARISSKDGPNARRTIPPDARKNLPRGKIATTIGTTSVEEVSGAPSAAPAAATPAEVRGADY